MGRKKKRSPAPPPAKTYTQAEVDQLKTDWHTKSQTDYDTRLAGQKDIWGANEAQRKAEYMLEQSNLYQDKLGDSIVIDSINFYNILPFIGFDKIKLIDDSLILPKGMKLDFNAIAQGYTVDVIGQFLQAKGDSNYLIEVGGEILVKGKNADGNTWRVGVDKPSE